MLNVKLGIKSFLLLFFISSNCLYSTAAKAFTATFDTGQIINTGSQTESGITVNYDFYTAGTAFDTTEDTNTTRNTGEVLNTDYIGLRALSDFNDGNAFQDTNKTIPTGATDVPLVVEVDNYVNYSFSFSKPVDLTDFRVGDLDYDHEDFDKYHDSIAVIAEKPDGSFFVATGETVGTDLQTYTATLISNPDNKSGFPDYLGDGITNIVPYRHNNHSDPVTITNSASNDATAVVYDASLQNVTGVNVLYWNEKNETSTDSDVMAISLNAQFQATEVPFEFSPSLGLIISGITIGTSQWLRNKHLKKKSF